MIFCPLCLSTYIEIFTLHSSSFFSFLKERNWMRRLAWGKFAACQANWPKRRCLRTFKWVNILCIDLWGGEDFELTPGIWKLFSNWKKTSYQNPPMYLYNAYLPGKIRILVCTDVASMGWDIKDLHAVVIIGKVSSTWKYYQMGQWFFHLIPFEWFRI